MAKKNDPRLNQDMPREERDKLTKRELKVWKINAQRRGRDRKLQKLLDLANQSCLDYDESLKSEYQKSSESKARNDGLCSRTNGAASLERNAGKHEGTQGTRVGKGGQRTQRDNGDGSNVGFPLHSAETTASS